MSMVCAVDGDIDAVGGGDQGIRKERPTETAHSRYRRNNGADLQEKDLEDGGSC